MIRNPILPGFNSDPCICRRGDDFYCAVASFEWFPGIPVYHSRDLAHWELYSHVLTNDEEPCLRGLPSAKGVWAPSLTYSEADGLFYVVYGVMRSMNGRYFDVENYLVSAPDPAGSWSAPVYIHSTGFDAALFCDDDGRKYVAALEWETRLCREKPGPICIVEVDPEKGAIGEPRRVWRGATDRGCIEGPRLTKRDGWYYLMCAEGGTGYYHAVTMARSRSVWGPYEADPAGVLLTSNPVEVNERADWDHLKPRYFNPEVALQKAGHGSYVDLPNGETWMTFHVSRPFAPELRCTLGREGAIQRMRWTEDGWLRKAGEGNLADELVEEPALAPCSLPGLPEHDDFDAPELGIGYYAPRIDPRSFTDLAARPGWARLRGQESGCSTNRVSLLARKLTSVHAEASTLLDFQPASYQHSAGLILYYDNMNWMYLRKYWSETLAAPALGLLTMENGVKCEFDDARVAAPAGDVWMRVRLDGRDVRFEWSADGETYAAIGPVLDLSKLSDEYSEYGEFTGTFVGLTCADRAMHRATADFDFFDYREN